MKVIYNVVYDPAYAPATVGDLYLPDTVTAETQLVLNIHGGGWSSLDRSRTVGISEFLVENNCIVYNIDYRLMGASDQHLPGSMNGTGLLSEYDRQMMAERGTTLAPGMKEKTYIQKFYLYLTLTRPTKQVYLTFSKTSSDGSSARPSYVVAELMRLFPAMKVQNVPTSLYEMELTKDSGIKVVVDGLIKREEGLSSEWKELYTRYKKDPEWKQQMDCILDATFHQKPNSLLSRETAKRLYGDVLENSVTRLEKFAKCAYAHFLSYGLGIEEREEYQFRALDLGNLFHSSLEKYADKLERAGFTWLNVADEEREKLMKESVDEAITDYSNSILYSSARNEYIISD